MLCEDTLSVHHDPDFRDSNAIRAGTGLMTSFKKIEFIESRLRWFYALST